MSYKITKRVTDSRLPAALRPVAIILADHAADDGTNVYPGIPGIARKLARSDRSIQRAIAKLIHLGVLELVDKGGPTPGKRGGLANHYRFNLDRLDVVTRCGDTDVVTRGGDMRDVVTPVSPQVVTKQVRHIRKNLHTEPLRRARVARNGAVAPSPSDSEQKKKSPGKSSRLSSAESLRLTWEKWTPWLMERDRQSWLTDAEWTARNQAELDARAAADRLTFRPAAAQQAA